MVAINKVGGIIMLISLFLPIVLLIIQTSLIFVWMFGLAYRENHFIWGIDIISLPFFISILVFSILCIVKDAGQTRVFGILSLVFVIIYYIIIFLIVSALAMITIVQITAYAIPFIGFFGIIIGSILNIAAK